MRRQKNILIPSSAPPLSGASDDELEELIQMTLPADHSQFEDAIRRFVRGIKLNIPGNCQRPASEFKPLVKEWHKRAALNTPSLSLDMARGVFNTAWRTAKRPLGTMEFVTYRARQAPEPKEVAIYEYDDPRTVMLIKVFRELHAKENGGTIRLDYKTAALAAGFMNDDTPDKKAAQRFSITLEDDGVLKRLSIGGRKKGTKAKASTYRFFGQPDYPGMKPYGPVQCPPENSGDTS